MPRDGEFDYRQLSRAQLEEALTRIDAAAYPKNYANLTSELAGRPPDAADQTSQRASATTPSLALPEWFHRAAESRSARLITRLGIAVVLVTAISGFILSDLVASAWLGSLQARTASVLALLAFLGSVSKRGPLFDVRRDDDRARFEKRAWVRNDLTRSATAALIGALLGVGCANGVGWAYTVAQGAPGERTFVATADFVRSSRGWWRCYRPDLEGVGSGLPRGLCFARRYPKGTRIKVAGAQSAFGIRAESVTIVGGPQR